MKKRVTKSKAEFVNYSKWLQIYNELMYTAGELDEWSLKYRKAYERLKSFRPNVKFS